MGVIDRLSVLFDALLSLVSALIRAAIIDPLFSNADYGMGCISGLVAALVIGYISAALLHSWDVVRGFFRARPASLTGGPSAFEATNGCVGAGLSLIFYVGLIIVFLIGLLRAILGP